MSTINTTINHGITLGSGYTSPLTVTNTGKVNNNGSGKAIFGGSATVVNYGHITATGTAPAGYGYPGIYLGAGYVRNSGTIIASSYGVFFQGVGSVVNSGYVYGRRFAVQSLGLFTVTNTGTITCSTQAILLSDGGFVDNSRVWASAVSPARSTTPAPSPAMTLPWP